MKFLSNFAGYLQLWDWSLLATEAEVCQSNLTDTKLKVIFFSIYNSLLQIKPVWSHKLSLLFSSLTTNSFSGWAGEWAGGGRGGCSAAHLSGGRRHPGWPHPGDWSRSDTCHSHTAPVRRQRCWPGTEPIRQNHNHVHPALGLVLQFIHLSVWHRRLLPPCGHQPLPCPATECLWHILWAIQRPIRV